MTSAFKMGGRVRVWPRPGVRVPEHPGIADRFLPADGAVVEWSTWWARRAGDGSILLTDPNAKTSAPARSGDAS